MVGSYKDKRTDKELFEYIKERFGNDWFSCQSSKISRDRLENLVKMSLLINSRETYTHSIYYKVA